MPKLYGLISSEPIRSINDSQLQEVAVLMDDIYTTLAQMTFIPETAIKRGHHHINASAFSCNHDATVLRVMELMPYVDHIQVQEESDKERMLRTDWLYGGEFVDYRNPRDLTDSCDPLRSWVEAQNSWVALTSWGSGGWNGDRTHLLVYDTSLNAISVWEGEEWVYMTDEHEPWQEYKSYEDYTGIGLFNHSLSRPLAALHKDHQEWKRWFNAPTLLRRILHAYETLAWTPWETSNREDGWGIPVDDIRALLHKHGWPHAFEPDNFNAAFICAKLSPTSTHGPAEAVYKRIEELEGESDMVGAGAIYGTREQLMSFEHQIKANYQRDEQEYWFWVYRTQMTRWHLQRQQDDLHRAREEFERLCPDGVCVKPGDEVLWELFYVEKEYNKMQRRTPVEEQCATELLSWKVDDGVDTTEEMQSNCVANRQRERHWLYLAYSQAKADALAHCSVTGCQMIPQPTLQDLITDKIAMLERHSALSRARAEAMNDWLPTLPEHAEKARKYFEMDMIAAVNGPHMWHETVEWLEKEAVGGEDGEGQGRLWRCLDDDGCIW